MKKALRYIRYNFRDCFRAAPGANLVTLIGYPCNAFEVIVRPILLAAILELALGNLAGNEKRFVWLLTLYGGVMLINPLNAVLARFTEMISTVRGSAYFGGKMFDFARKIRLEALEDPDSLDRFKRADSVVGDNAEFFLVDSLLAVFTGLCTCVGTMIVVGSYSGILVMAAMAGAVPSLLFQMQAEKRETDVRRRRTDTQRKHQYYWELFTKKDAVKEMRSMGFDTYIKDKWQQSNRELTAETRGIQYVTVKKGILAVCIENVFYAFNIAVSLVLMLQGKIGIGQFAACLGAFAGFQSALQKLYFDLARIVKSYHRIEEYYDYFEIETEEDGEEEYVPFQKEIAVRDAAFRYSGGEKDALQGVNLNIKKGEHVVIVGENGSGKTTLAKLITGAYQPKEGQICYDGQRGSALKRDSLYSHISIVPQSFVHYNFTLQENVGIADLSRMGEEKEMERLIGRVAGEEFLAKTGGLKGQLGREFGGVELSGGEWQKVAIARGLWKDSDIIILDEPTSALDPLVEYDILSNFVEMIRDKTSVIISHRVGICRDADKIIVMKEGRAVECGSHEELLEKGGEYRRIWQEQAKWYA